jgi:hypothetical protein
MTTARTSLTPIRIGIIVLTLATALIHLRLAFQFPTPDIVFILNALGYLALLAALYLPIPQLEGYRGLVRWVFIGYTALTIVLYFLFNGFFFFFIGYLDKLIEVALILLLFIEGRAQSRR